MQTRACHYPLFLPLGKGERKRGRANQICPRQILSWLVRACILETVFAGFFCRTIPPQKSSALPPYPEHPARLQKTSQCQFACVQAVCLREGLRPARLWQFGNIAQIPRSLIIVCIAGAPGEARKICRAGAVRGPESRARLPEKFL